MFLFPDPTRVIHGCWFDDCFFCVERDMPTKEAQSVVVQGVDDWQRHGGTNARDAWLKEQHGPRAPEQLYDHMLTVEDERRDPVVILCPHTEPGNMLRFHATFSSRWASLIHLLTRSLAHSCAFPGLDYSQPCMTRINLQSVRIWRSTCNAEFASSSVVRVFLFLLAEYLFISRC